ncbi:Tudor domain-containing protein 7 [Homalodisca vitripennis]|nr:Tudor domain-containing protein 7 [Homalodisca vitripennis]
MYQMQAYYQATGLPQADAKYVIKGQLFAAQYIDDYWYRVVVTEAINGTKVAVRLCDYGDMTCEPVSNLRDLEEEFQRLPFMAIKGKLAGVVPLHTDWSVDDCVQFQNLVVDKPLTSNVIYIEENFEDPMETVVSLHLRDIQNDKEEKTENAAEGYAAKKAGTKVAVRLCDYGDMTREPVSNLRDLEEEFQRLPFMAIKGKLAGVVPLHTDWSVDDCVRFQNLVADKPLTSNVIYIEENFEDPMETVVSLHLRDIQNDKEEVIKDILIKENGECSRRLCC